MTLNRYIMNAQRQFPGATGDLTQLLNCIVTSVKAITSAVRMGGMTSALTKDCNQKLNMVANDFFINMLRSSYTVAAMVSEFNQEIINVETEKQGRYYVYFDPLDGSSNIDCLGAIGSIFGIAKKTCEGPPTKEDILKCGNNYVASGYALYGSATILVLTTGQGVNGFTFDPAIGEFILTDPNMQIKPRGKIYSLNEGYESQWDEKLLNYITSLKHSSEEGRSAYGSRYIGSMVADVHRTIKYGGIFIYPSYKSAPNGKLRVLYECNPMAHIIEQAGECATDGNKRILDLQPESLHHRTPIFLGSKHDMDEYHNFGVVEEITTEDKVNTTTIKDNEKVNDE